MLSNAAGVRVAVGASVVLGLASTATIVVQAVALAGLLASAFGEGHHGDRALLLWLAGAAVARAGLALAGEVLATFAASSAKARLRSLLVGAVVGRSARAAANSTGDVATLAGRGLDALDVYVGRCIPDLVLAVVAPVALIAAVGALDWLSALVLVCVIALFPVFGSLIGRAGAELARGRWEQVRALGGQLLELFEGLPVLKAFGRSADERKRVEQAGEALRRASLDSLRIAFLSALVLDTLASVSVALVAVPLGLRLLDGSVGLAPALAVLVIAPEVFLPLRRASAEFHESTEGLAAASDAYSLIDARSAAGTPASPDSEGRAVTEAPDPRRIPVTLSSVSLAFPGSSGPVLESCTLEIAPAEKVVLCGANGAGKSTLLAVVLGMLVPDSGTVVVGDHDLRSLEPASWRSRLAYLPDRPALLGATLAENLRIANPCASDDDLVDALFAVGAKDMLRSLPHGLETPIGEGGRAVSAGERQRIGLARIVLRDASLYVLDEPTVHLDPDTEQKAIAALRLRLAGSSALIVTHRSAPVMLADRVLELRDAKIVEACGLEPGTRPSVCAAGSPAATTARS
jgi:thiol reductant ABC exporter CydD subunit